VNSFLWWSGAIAWLSAGSVGIFLGLDWVVDEIADSFNFKRQFLAFVWARLAKRESTPLFHEEKT
jgi:hypothetical protein